ncbi:MAG: CD225/dispanin family protein [Maribacter sp.]|nr:CD225/dispanin family protein [Maribacter sp.]
MEQRKLPNVTIALVLAIVSFLCCCIGGIPGAILSGIAFFLVSKDEKLYRQEPESYSNYSQLKTAKTLAIIGLVIGILWFMWTWYQIYEMGGWDAYMEKSKELMEQWGVEQE